MERKGMGGCGKALGAEVGLGYVVWRACRGAVEAGFELVDIRGAEIRAWGRA